MNESTYNMLSSSFRILWMSATSHVLVLLTMNTLLERKRSLCGIITYFAVKILLMNTLLAMTIKEFYYEFYIGAKWFQTIRTLGLVSTAVLTFVIIWYTYKGELVQVAMCALIGETVAVFISYFSFVTINFWSGREIFAHEVVFQVEDLGIPVISFGVFFLFRHCFHSQLAKFKEYKFKHKKILLSLFILYITMATVSLVKENYADDIISYGTMSISLGGLVFLLLKVKQYGKNMKVERESLQMQQQLLERHYNKVKEQIRLVETNRKTTDAQMQAVTAIRDNAL